MTFVDLDSGEMLARCCVHAMYEQLATAVSQHRRLCNLLYCGFTLTFCTALQDPASGEKLEKSVFVVFFAGERARQKITKV